MSSWPSPQKTLQWNGKRPTSCGVNGSRVSAPGRIVADARYVLDDSGVTAEFAIAVADDWQHAGLGRELLLRLADHARAHGVLRLHGDVLWDNLPMQRMVAALGGTLAGVSRNAGMLEARFDF